MNMLKLPPPIWTLLFLILTAGLSYLAGWPTFPQVHSFSVGIGLMAVSFIAPVWALILFRREGTQVSSTSEINDKLVTTGPFRFTRNPMYLGLVVLSLGVAVATGAVPMFVAPLLVFATANWVHIPFEEAKMRHQFGPAFDDYARNVRRWL
jgi:protein-S-isoprenylcysteine O-methyltransferase Ste14